MAVLQQGNLFDQNPGRKKPRAAKAAPHQGLTVLPVNPPDLTQESALWLLGQRSIEVQRAGRYVPESIKHPGKMQPDVAGAIIDTYTEPGQRIIDAMGGIGTMAVEAAERGRHVVMVELEEPWANVAQQNADLTARRGAPGTIKVIQGDSRRLPELVAGAFDHLVTSPPYGQALEPRSGRVEGRVERIQAAIERGELDPGEHDTWARKVSNQGHGVLGQEGLVASMDPSYVRGNWHMGEGQRAMMDPGYSPGADAVITSPPFADTLNQSETASDVEARERRLEAAGHDGYKFGPNSAQAQPQRYDAAVMSPPFGPVQRGNGLAATGFSDDRRPLLERCGGGRYDLSSFSVLTSKQPEFVDGVLAGQTHDGFLLAIEEPSNSGGSITEVLQAVCLVSVSRGAVQAQVPGEPGRPFEVTLNDGQVFQVAVEVDPEGEGPSVPLGAIDVAIAVKVPAEVVRQILDGHIRKLQGALLVLYDPERFKGANQFVAVDGKRVYVVPWGLLLDDGMTRAKQEADFLEQLLIDGFDAEVAFGLAEPHRAICSNKPEHVGHIGGPSPEEVDVDRMTSVPSSLTGEDLRAPQDPKSPGSSLHSEDGPTREHTLQFRVRRIKEVSADNLVFPLGPTVPCSYDDRLPDGEVTTSSIPQPRFDCLCTSPAYGDIRQDGGNHQFGESGAMGNYSGEARVKKTRDRTNVGNLKYGSMEKALALIARLKAGESIPESEWPGMEYLETMP